MHGSDNGVVKISSLGPFCDMEGLICDNFAVAREVFFLGHSSVRPSARAM